MANETTSQTTIDGIETVEEMNNEAYIQAINELKANTISLDKYNKLRAENKKLLDSLVSGNQIELPTKEEKPDIQALRAKLRNTDTDLNNLEFIETGLKLRNALIESGERDPFLPIGDKTPVTSEIIEKAERVAEGLQAMVDFAEGDSGIFSAEYQRRVQDTGIPARRRP